MKEKKQSMHRVVLVDGNALAFRSLFSHEALTTKVDDKVIYTGLIFGFIKMLIYVKKEYNPKKFVVFWDGGSTRKKEIYPDYKKGRKFKTKDMNFDDVKNSLDYCRKLLKYVGIQQFRVFGEEGDDIIASYISQNPGKKYFILSNDHDMFQLIGKGIVVIRMKQGDTTLWNIKKFITDHGFEPKYYTHYLSLIGDSTDNIPGAKGIGPKAAQNIFAQMKKPTIKMLYNSIDDIEMTPNIKNKLLMAKNDVKLFFKIIKLKEDIELIPLNNNQQKPIKLLSILRDLRFKSIYSDPDMMNSLCGL